MNSSNTHTTKISSPQTTAPLQTKELDPTRYATAMIHKAGCISKWASAQGEYSIQLHRVWLRKVNAQLYMPSLEIRTELLYRAHYRECHNCSISILFLFMYVFIFANPHPICLFTSANPHPRVYFHWFLKRVEGRGEREREGNIDITLIVCLLQLPQPGPGIEPATEVHALEIIPLLTDKVRTESSTIWNQSPFSFSYTQLWKNRPQNSIYKCITL